jgi:hypothetical protein
MIQPNFILIGQSDGRSLTLISHWSMTIGDGHGDDDDPQYW